MTMATSSTVMNFFFISIAIAIFSVPSISASASQTPVTKALPFILSINKDPETNLFYSSVGIGTPRQNFDLVIDLATENLYYSADRNYNSSSYRAVQCHTKACPNTTDVCLACGSGSSPRCHESIYICSVLAINPFEIVDFVGDLAQDIVFISQQQVSDLRLNFIGTADGFDDNPLLGFPKSSRGALSLSRSELAIPIQLASANKLPPKFSLCLPSSNKQGFTNLLLGYGGLGLGLPQELTKFLQTTPLILNPFTTSRPRLSIEYFIDVKSVKIDGQVVNFNSSLLSFDKKGNGGTKLSTTSAFSQLQSLVYKPFVQDFLNKASARRIKRVASVSPFEACFDSTTIGSSVTGLLVPTIDLVLQGGVQWTIYGANSMVMAKENVACLAFLDAGRKPKRGFKLASVVIGGNQLQDNLLVFDVASSKFSFSSSLLLHNETCSQVSSMLMSPVE